MTDPKNHLLFSELPDPRDEQFRMRQLQVWNWGTFSALHTLDIAEDGHLIIGPSAAGKSTLLDAITAMTAQPMKVRFNAAAEEGAARGRDRSVMSYIRGAWSEKSDESSGSIVKQYLRPGATWSAIALSYKNGLGRTITLVRLFWVTGAALSSDAVNRHFMVVDEAFDLRELSEFDANRAKLRKSLDRPTIRHHDDSFSSYQEQWCGIVGIEDETALDLLHRAQSTKSLGNLNEFLRDFMLSPPQTFEKAAAFVEEFGNLNEAHIAVVDARKKIEVLSPARAGQQERTLILDSVLVNAALSSQVTPFCEGLRCDLLDQSIAANLEAIKSARSKSEELEVARRSIDEELSGLRVRRTNIGGGRIEQLQGDLKALEGRRIKATSTREIASSNASSLGWSLAANSADFNEQKIAAKNIADKASDALDSFDERRLDIASRRKGAEDDLALMRKEIAALESSPTSIPSNLKDLRARLCQELGLDLGDLVFVGELIQVSSEHRDEWGPAAERLLRGFALNLLVPDSKYSYVARIVNSGNLRLKLVYHAVGKDFGSVKKPSSDRSILKTIEFHKHPFSRWVESQLFDKYDYERVDTPEDLSEAPYRITRQGQIRHGGWRTEKNDVSRIDDRSAWVLGFDNREKLALYKEQAFEKSKSITGLMSEDVSVKSEKEGVARQSEAARLLSLVEWEDIDVSSIATSIDEISAQIDKILNGNTSLADVDARIALAEEAKIQTITEATKITISVKDKEAAIGEDRPKLEASKVTAAALEEKYKRQLQALLPGWETLSIRGLEAARTTLAEHLNGEALRLERDAGKLLASIEKAFTEFLRRWPGEAGGLSDSIDFADDFLSLLSRIEDDGLPAHQKRFEDLLRNQSRQRLAELQRHLGEGRREITRRLEDVNNALGVVPYNPGSYLRIINKDLRLKEPDAFRQRLTDLFADQKTQQTEDPQVAEEQFTKLHGLYVDLKADDPEKRRWRDMVLDVRRHFEFSANEIDRKTDTVIDVYTGGGDRSGGQRQKLTSTCLAAALRYKLGGADGGVPLYAPVVLDEAFTKTDSDFTAASMKIFTQLGFQMILATPIKSVMTLEEFVGGATFVQIRDRQQSGLLPIEYDPNAKRVLLGGHASSDEGDSKDAID